MRSIILFGPRSYVAAALALLAISPPAAAQTSARDPVRMLDGLAACRAIATDTERLACFDDVAGRITAARAAGELLAFDREKVTAERRVQFGLVDVPRDAGEAAAARAAKVREITSTITGVAQGPGYGLWILSLQNGQRWQTLGPDRYGPRPGARIKLVTTVTGGFRASIDSGKAIQVRRTR